MGKSYSSLIYFSLVDRPQNRMQSCDWPRGARVEYDKERYAGNLLWLTTVAVHFTRALLCCESIP
jgi:hypothetical protein